jgi:hypothetical protein
MSAKKIYPYFLTLFFLIFTPGCSNNLSITPAPLPHPKDQILFVAVDGIPFQMVKELYDQRKLTSFQPPSRVISTFPSTTTTGFTGLFKPLGAKAAPGYDARFFSYAQNEVKGNLLDAYDFEAADYNRYFSYNRNTGFKQIVMYTAPHFALRRDLSRLQSYLWDHPEKESIFFYIGSTDGAGHLDGYEKTRELFMEVMRKVQSICKAYKKEFKKDLTVVLFSDHGFHWNRMKKIDLSQVEEHLKTIGFTLADDLKEDKRVVAITWGNISGGDLYTSDEVTPRVAELLTGIPGIDLVTYQQKGHIFVTTLRAAPESAEIYFDKEGKQFGYQPIQGDPLHYLPVLEQLKKENKLNSSGFASESDWFEKTQDQLYPDAPYRLKDAFYGLVKNPATILISTQEDYEFGDSLTRFGASLRGGMIGTHGALSLDSSSAFVMTNDPNVKLAPVVRYDEALVPFKDMNRNPPPLKVRGGQGEI